MYHTPYEYMWEAKITVINPIINVLRVFSQPLHTDKSHGRQRSVGVYRYHYTNGVKQLDVIGSKNGK